LRDIAPPCAFMPCSLEHLAYQHTSTFPTTYIAYEGFGVVPKCTGTASALTLAQPTDPAHLIFPSDEDFGSMSSNIANYLDSLHPAGNLSDLSQCSFAVGAQKFKIRRENLPFPVGRRSGPVFGRANVVQNNTNPVVNLTPVSLFPLPIHDIHHFLIAEHGRLLRFLPQYFLLQTAPMRLS
jgi:hypothetical protein